MAVAHTTTPEPDHPGPRALEFITWAVDTYGTPSNRGDNTALILASQAELVLAHPRVDSAGTVAYYVRRLRRAGVITSTRPIEVDLDALHDLDAANTHTPPLNTPGQHERTSGGEAPDASPTDLVELLARHNELVATALSALAESLVVQNQILAALHTDPRGTRDSANQDVAEPANIRGIREPQEEGRKGFDLKVVENPDLPDLPDVAEPANLADQFADTTEPLPRQVLDEALRPLQQWCIDNGKPARIDDRGRAVLAHLNIDELHAGVRTIRTEAAAGSDIRNPLGLLIQRAQAGDTDTFRPTKPATPRTQGDPGRSADLAAWTLAATLAEQGDGPDAIEQYLLAKSYSPNAAAQVAIEVTATP